METDEQFHARVLERTGVEYHNLPRREVTGGALNTILVKRGDEFVVGVGYPDEDGVFEKFELVVAVPLPPEYFCNYCGSAHESACMDPP